MHFEKQTIGLCYDSDTLYTLALGRENHMNLCTSFMFQNLDLKKLFGFNLRAFFISL